MKAERRVHRARKNRVEQTRNCLAIAAIAAIAATWPLVGAFGAANAAVPGAPSGHPLKVQASKGDATLVAGTVRYNLRLATTPDQQAQGLSGLKSLPVTTGMLFVFPRTAEQCFWMKGMHFSLDIIWLSAVDKVLLVHHDLSPRTYPMSFCSSARYVVELVAGQAEAGGITVGRTVRIEMPES